MFVTGVKRYLLFIFLLLFFAVLMQIADLYDLCEGVSGSLACNR